MDSSIQTDLNSLRLIIEIFSGKDQLPEKILRAIRDIRQIGWDNQDRPEFVRSAFIVQTQLLRLLVSTINASVIL